MKFTAINFLGRFKFHFVFWFLFIGLFIGLNLSSSGRFTPIDLFKSTAEIVISSAILVYINLYFFIPKFFYTGKYFLYGAILIVFIPLYILIQSAVETRVLDLYNNINDPSLFRHVFTSNLVIAVVFVVVTTTLKLSRKWLMSREEMNKLKLEKLETELQFLRTQINPHFLFNTLNNLYSLILSKENDKAGEMVLKLSGIMDYMIHDSALEWINLNTEISHLKNYLDLERIRFPDAKGITFNCESDSESYKISPYILLPLVENGFKHGIGNTIHNGFIKVNVKARNGSLDFYVENSKPSRNTHVSGNGIGLTNIRRRLEILYPEIHSLNINDNHSSYNVHLKLPLNEYPLPHS